MGAATQEAKRSAGPPRLARPASAEGNPSSLTAEASTARRVLRHAVTASGIVPGQTPGPSFESASSGGPALTQTTRTAPTSSAETTTAASPSSCVHSATSWRSA